MTADDLRITLALFERCPHECLQVGGIVVADGASTDDTLNVMSTFMDVSVM